MEALMGNTLDNPFVVFAVSLIANGSPHMPATFSAREAH
jgi:hypothetical protein